MTQAYRATKERKENRPEDITTTATEGTESESQECLDLRAQEARPSLVHQALRGHLVNQEEAMMGNLDHQGRPDLREHPYLAHTGAHRPSIFLDLRDRLECLDNLDTHQGSRC